MDKIMLYGIGGFVNEKLLNRHGFSLSKLLDIAVFDKAIGVSVHGQLPNGDIISGEMSIDDARQLFRQHNVW